MLLFLAGVMCAGEPDSARLFDVPAGDAAESLRLFAQQSRQEIIYPSESVKGVRTNAVAGRFTPWDAIERLLAGTELVVTRAKGGAIAVNRAASHQVQSNKDSARTPARGTSTGSNRLPTNAEPHAPKTMKQKNLVSILGGLLALIVGPVDGQTIGSTGTIEGRVFNVASESYLNNARVTVRGTALETFTSDSGEYRLANVPSGTVEVVAIYTGLDGRVSTVTVPAGGTVRLDIELTRAGQAAGEDPVRLDKFVVAVNRELDAQAIAINEQRYAANIKNVVSADEFGDIAEGNIGDFIKFMPGVYVNYSAGSRATSISVRGFPSNATDVSMDGDQVANTGNNRGFDLQGFQAMNNIARVEVIKSPTPDVPASMLGGRVNMVTKSAFERSKPSFSYRVGGTYNTELPLGSFPSYVREERMSSIRPSANFGYIVPLNKTLGFTISGAHNSRLINNANAEGSWDLIRLLQTSYEIIHSPQLREATSGAVTVDWKFAEKHVLSGTLSHVESRQLPPRNIFRANLGNNPVGDTTFSQSAAATGTATMISDPGNDLRLKTWHLKLKHRYDGPVWKTDLSTFYSLAVRKARQGDKVGFDQTNSVLPSVRIRFDDIGLTGRPGPGRISATDAAGQPVDFWDANNYQLRTVTDNRQSGLTTVTGGQFNATRSFNLPVPTTLKTGLYLNRQLRDRRNSPRQWTFLGPDGIANNADNVIGRYDFIAREMSKEPLPYGFPLAQRLSPDKVADYFKAHPEQFSLNEVNAISGRVNNSDKIIETISAAYLRGDVKLMNNRLRLVAGTRFERTENEGWGGLNDIGATLVRNPDGSFARDSQGRTIPITTNAVERALLQFTERGAHNKRSYGNFYPSFNASYNITESMIGRFAYARTIGRPNFNNIIPGVSVSNPDASNPNITVSNPGLRPWTADAFDLSLEKYFTSNSVVSMSLFRKNISDFFGALTTPATRELLDSYGLPDDLVGYEWRTTHNIDSDARVSGVEFNYRHALTFLPAWARGIQVFANGTLNKLEGNQDADFSNFAKRIYNYGISINRSRFALKLNWTTNEPVRESLANTNATTPPGTHVWTAARTILDANLEVRINRQLSLYATAANLNNQPYRRDRYAAETPPFARNNRYKIIGTSIIFGVKGEF